MPNAYAACFMVRPCACLHFRPKPVNQIWHRDEVVLFVAQEMALIGVSDIFYYRFTSQQEELAFRHHSSVN
ncbi:hypothetical protein [Gluconobacter cerinus]|uniref:hypothetical protein n=1 Tax=Gluconobacter cerinus TaxID=38307 RepID=UPI001C05DEBC|nr:hypothetical protein [Gluconobacter cerinus]